MYLGNANNQLHLQTDGDQKILIHLNVFEEKEEQRVQPAAKPKYSERVEVIPCDDGWPEYCIMDKHEINERQYCW